MGDSKIPRRTRSRGLIASNNSVAADVTRISSRIRVDVSAKDVDERRDLRLDPLSFRRSRRIARAVTRWPMVIVSISATSSRDRVSFSSLHMVKYANTRERERGGH